MAGLTTSCPNMNAIVDRIAAPASLMELVFLAGSLPALKAAIGHGADYV